MISIGNDIVALDQTDKQRTNDTRFHSKFITPAELQLYQGPVTHQISFESFVWLLWAVKESAYKYQQRLEPDLLFSPAKIKVDQLIIPTNVQTSIDEPDVLLTTPYTGTVSLNNRKLYFKAVADDVLIASVVDTDNSFAKVYWKVQRISSANSEDQSKLVRQALLRKLKTILPVSEFLIKKNEGNCPYLMIDGNVSAIPISFAHHGEYISYAFKLV